MDRILIMVASQMVWVKTTLQKLPCDTNIGPKVENHKITLFYKHKIERLVAPQSLTAGKSLNSAMDIW
jgi:hypothetical protein